MFHESYENIAYKLHSIVKENFQVLNAEVFVTHKPEK